MKWIFPEEQPNDLISFLLEQRNVSDRDAFFNPSAEQLHSYTLLHDIDKASDAIIKAINANKKIAIHGDFDVDGVTATTIMWRFLYQDLKADVFPYIPSRFTEGYGLSVASLEAVVASGAKLLITVDCGVKDIELVHRYSSKLAIVITDHHTLLTQKELNTKTKELLDHSLKVGEYYISKEAKAVVHPKLAGYPFKDICGAAVSWKVCCAVNDKLGFKVDMTKYLDLVALGTVCDVMPMYNENRSMVHLGLKQLQKTVNPGLKALLDLAAYKNDVDEYTLGFQLGPSINAAGRLNHALEAVRMLSTNDPVAANQIAVKLNSLNVQRQELTKQYLLEAEAQIGAQKNNLVYVIKGDAWPEGIIGLIAGKLSEKYNRAVLIASQKDGKLKGSARSIESFDISSALKNLNTFLLTHGGHAQAAGFTMLSTNWDDFSKKLNEYANSKINSEDIKVKLVIDAVVEISQITPQIVHSLDSFAPFGIANPKPVFALLNKKIQDVRFFGEDLSHVRFILRENGYELPVVGFGLADKVKKSSFSIDLAGSFYIDTYNNLDKVSFKPKEIRDN